MSRGVALSVLRARLKAEIKEVQETNTALDTELNYALEDGQKKLADGNDWPFLMDRWDVTGNARYLTFPSSNIRGVTATINLQRPLLVERKYNTLWQEIPHGIGGAQYNYIDSDSGRTQDPIQRWQLDTNTGDTTSGSVVANQFEIWPVPINAQTIRFTGQRQVRDLAVDADKADLDDLLIVYFTAMEYLMLRDLGNATIATKKFQDHFITIRGTQPSSDCPPIILGARQRYSHRAVKLIATATS